MILGALDGFPFIRVDEAERRAVVEERDLGEALASFYESFYSGDFSFLAPNPRSAQGFSAFLARAKADPAFGPKILKAQVVGPLTLAQSLKFSGSQSAGSAGSAMSAMSAMSAVDAPDVLEALSLGLGAKAAWLASQIRAVGREALIFIDEPGLTGYGSAFSTLSAETVLKALGQAVETAKSQGPAAIGCHVCGNTDWGLLSQAGLDVLNFDAFNHLEPFCLYPRELSAFLAKGGYVAFGLVPTEDFKPEMTAKDLLDRLWAGLKPLWRRVDRDLLTQRSLLSTSCGLGSLPPESARAIFRLLAQTAQAAQAKKELG
jgi:hypothetical protein